MEAWNEYFSHRTRRLCGIGSVFGRFKSKKGSKKQKRFQEPKALQRVSAETESVDEYMSQLASQLPVAPISLSKAQSTPLSSRPRFTEEQSIDLALAEEGLNESLHAIANDLLESTLR